MNSYSNYPINKLQSISKQTSSILIRQGFVTVDELLQKSATTLANDLRWNIAEALVCLKAIREEIKTLQLADEKINVLKSAVTHNLQEDEVTNCVDDETRNSECGQMAASVLNRTRLVSNIRNPTNTSVHIPLDGINNPQGDTNTNINTTTTDDKLNHNSFIDSSVDAVLHSHNIPNSTISAAINTSTNAIHDAYLTSIDAPRQLQKTEHHHKKRTAFDMIYSETDITPLTTMSDRMNSILGGGIHCGQITEICGVPGIGKTNIALQLAANATLPIHLGGWDSDVLYIDTENTFHQDRFLDILCALEADVKLRKSLSIIQDSRNSNKDMSTITNISLQSGETGLQSNKRMKCEGDNPNVEGNVDDNVDAIDDHDNPTTLDNNTSSIWNKILQNTTHIPSYSAKDVCHRIHKITTSNRGEFLSVLTSLSALVESHSSIKLVVIDSFTTPLRNIQHLHTQTQAQNTNHSQYISLLKKTGDILVKFAKKHNIAVVLTSQVTTKFVDSTNINAINAVSKSMMSNRHGINIKSPNVANTGNVSSGGSGKGFIHQLYQNVNSSANTDVSEISSRNVGSDMSTITTDTIRNEDSDQTSINTTNTNTTGISSLTSSLTSILTPVLPQEWNQYPDTRIMARWHDNKRIIYAFKSDTTLSTGPNYIKTNEQDTITHQSPPIATITPTATISPTTSVIPKTTIPYQIAEFRVGYEGIRDTINIHIFAKVAQFLSQQNYDKSKYPSLSDKHDELFATMHQNIYSVKNNIANYKLYDEKSHWLFLLFQRSKYYICADIINHADEIKQYEKVTKNYSNHIYAQDDPWKHFYISQYALAFIYQQYRYDDTLRRDQHVDRMKNDDNNDTFVQLSLVFAHLLNRMY